MDATCLTDKNSIQDIVASSFAEIFISQLNEKNKKGGGTKNIDGKILQPRSRKDTKPC
jgi:hypothetical protein